MKIRNGFVSNSSSSSFLIAIPKDADFKTLFFGNKEKVKNEYSWDDNDVYFDTDNVISVMNKKLKEVFSLDEMYEQIQGFWYDSDEFKGCKYGSTEYRDLVRLRDAREYCAIYLFTKINKERFPNCKFYVGSFASDGGDRAEAMLRSSSIWRRVPFICSSD